MCCHEDRHCHHSRHEVHGHDCHGRRGRSEGCHEHREMGESHCCHRGDNLHDVPAADRIGILSKQVAAIKEKVEWLERELAEIGKAQEEPGKEDSDKE